jgi:biotin carboxyl carrier protein
MANRKEKVGLDRREFLKAASLAGIGLAGYLAGSLSSCATFDPRIAKDLKDFDIRVFNRWYERNRLWNEPNPHVRGRHTVNNTYRNCIEKGYTPGVDYSVPTGEIMTSPAPGYIWGLDEIVGTGRLGGLWIGIRHSPEYESRLNHVAGLLVKTGDKVERNQPICIVPAIYSKFAKLMLIESAERIDPDDYGPNHSYMNYFTEPLAIDAENGKNENLVAYRESRQTEIILDLEGFRIGRETDSVFQKWYNKGGYKPTKWSKARQFKYLETLYEVRPQLFPGITQKEFEAIKKEFYANQPIILTLPFIMAK